MNDENNTSDLMETAIQHTFQLAITKKNKKKTHFVACLCEHSDHRNLRVDYF